jgi:hypothetical protein
LSHAQAQGVQKEITFFGGADLEKNAATTRKTVSETLEDRVRERAEFGRGENEKVMQKGVKTG